MDHLVTQYLDEIRAGDAGAFDKLVPLVYDDLRSIARRLYIGNPNNRTLHPTALVHEAYARLAKGGHLAFEDRRHFLRVATRAMRQLLANYARNRKAEKRGGDGVEHVTLAGIGGEDPSFQLVQLDDALDRLAELSERQARVAELRLLSELSVEETAQVLEVAPRTVKSDWSVAKVWLARALDQSDATD